jgi:hypothetical protein
MKHRPTIRSYAAAALALLLFAAPAHAQYRPRPLNDPATGEKYHIEAAAGLWFPSADIAVSSEGFGIAGTSIDFKKDLGLLDKKFGDFRLVLRPSKRNKFRFEFIPIKYESTATLTRNVVFNGISDRLGLPVASLLDWKAYRVGYEFDVVSRNRGFAGFIIEAKLTDVKVQLTSTVANEFAHAQAPIPAIGGIGRVYVVPNISITGEVTGFRLPENLVKNTHAHYVDVDVYGTLNFTNNVGAQVGYRSLDLGYVQDADTGTMKLKGMYFGLVARY